MGRIALNERLMGYDSNGKKCIICDFICDSVSDLPTQTVYTDYVLMIGCTASMIDSGDIYKINSLGTWNLSQTGTGTYTKSEIDNLLSTKQNVLTFDSIPTQNSVNPVYSGGVWLPLAELIDTGAKNIVDISKTTFTTNTKDGVTVSRTGENFTVTGTGGTSTNNFFNLYYAPNDIFIPSGTWVFYLDGIGLDDIRLEVSDDVSPDVQKGLYGENPYICTVPDGITRSHFRICTRAGVSFVNTSFRIMICTPTLWDISNSYQPYCPSMRELYQMILALQ